MGRKKKVKEISRFFADDTVYHVDEKMWCDRDERRETILVCLYRCADKANCASYAKKYDEILDMEIPEKYLLKYGTPERPVPNALIKKQKREAKQAKEQVKIDKKIAKDKKLAEKEAKAKSVKKRKPKSVPVPPPAEKKSKSAPKSKPKNTTKAIDLTNW